MSEILFNENSELLPVTRQKVIKLREILKQDKLTPWYWFNSRGINVTDFYGKTISLKGAVYGGGTEILVFFSFIVPFLQDAVVKILDETLETCRTRGLMPEEPYIRETSMVLEGYLIHPIYDYMADIDRNLRGKGNPKSVGRRDVTDEITAMVKFLDEQKDEMIRGIKAADLANLKPAETGRKATINVNISGDVQAENLQIGDDAFINKQQITKEKKKGIIGRIPYWIYIVISFLAALFTCVGYLLGWLGPIKTFITKIIWPK